MSHPTIEQAKQDAIDALSEYGRPAKVAWAGKGGSAVRAATPVNANVTFVTGKRTSQIRPTDTVVTIAALMSPVKLNPVGATVTVGAASYKIIDSEDLGQAPDDIAGHKLVVVPV